VVQPEYIVSLEGSAEAKAINIVVRSSYVAAWSAFRVLALRQSSKASSTKSHSKLPTPATSM
jgi:hypothetical protein